MTSRYKRTKFFMKKIDNVLKENDETAAEYLMTMLKKKNGNIKRYVYLKYRENKERLYFYFFRRAILSHRGDFGCSSSDLRFLLQIFHYDLANKYKVYNLYFSEINWMKIEDILDIYNTDSRNIHVCFDLLYNLHRKNKNFKRIAEKEIDRILSFLEIYAESFDSSEKIPVNLGNILKYLYKNIKKTRERICSIFKKYDLYENLSRFDIFFSIIPKESVEAAENYLNSKKRRYSIGIEKDTIKEMIFHGYISTLKKFMVLTNSANEIANELINSKLITVEEYSNLIIEHSKQTTRDYFSPYIFARLGDYNKLFGLVYKGYIGFSSIREVFSLISLKKSKMEFICSLISFLKNNKELFSEKNAIGVINMVSSNIQFLNSEDIEFLQSIAIISRLTCNDIQTKKTITTFITTCEFLRTNEL